MCLCLWLAQRAGVECPQKPVRDYTRILSTNAMVRHDMARAHEPAPPNCMQSLEGPCWLQMQIMMSHWQGEQQLFVMPVAWMDNLAPDYVSDFQGSQQEDYFAGRSAGALSRPSVQSSARKAATPRS